MLLTHDDCKAIATSLNPPTQALIDGAFRPAISGRTFDMVNPATGAVLAQVADCGTQDVDFAVTRARNAFEDGRWSRLAPRDRKEALILREPVGVLGLVLPWNFPLLILAWKIGPALAAGCAVIVRPAKETSLTTLRVAELALEAGTPPGVLNVLPGGGETGESIGRHMDIDAATALANDTGYGLTASIFTANVKRALRGGEGDQGGNRHGEQLWRGRYLDPLWRL